MLKKSGSKLNLNMKSKRIIYEIRKNSSWILTYLLTYLLHGAESFLRG